jgi:uncharacterized C2H2 Zn-finger protein
MSFRDQFGKARIGAANNSNKVFSVDEKGGAYRLFPSMKSCAQDGVWAVYHAVHWGYEIPNPKNPEKTFKKPFKCVQRKSRDGMIVEECPQCKLIESKKNEFEKVRAGLLAKGRSEEQIKQIMTPANQWLRTYNTDGKWYIAVKSVAGDFGMLKIPHKMKMDLEGTIEKIKSKHKIDVFDIDTGCWINFIRTGSTGSQMNFKTELVMEEVEINGKFFESPKLAPLSEDDLERAIREIPDLRNANQLVLTKEQIVALVETGGDPELVAKILNASTRTAESSASPSAPKAPVASLDDDEEEMRKLLGTPAPARAAAPPAPVAAPPKAAPAPVVDDSEMSDDEFLKQYQMNG